MHTPSDALPMAPIARDRASRRWRALGAVAAAALMAGCGTAHQARHAPDAAGAAMGQHGLQKLRSPHSQAVTLERLEAQVRKRQLTVVARVDHAAAAQRAGQTLLPTVVMIFGNPQAGTPLMQCAQATGIDLPMKALVWTDAAGAVWLGWNDPRWIAHRHGAGDCAPASRLAQALNGLAQAVVAP